MPLKYTLPPAQRARLAPLAKPVAHLPRARLDACDLCDGRVFRTVARSDRYGFPNTYDLCESCGLVFQNPRPSREGYTSFYERIYRPLVSAYQGRVINAETMQADQHRYAAWLTDFLHPHVTGVQHGVDLGGSTGIIASTVRQALGGEWLVVDPSPDEVAVATRQGLSAEVGVAETWDPGGRRFDLILICRSIDHCLSVTTALTRAREALHPDGLLFVDVVDFGSLATIRPDYRKCLKVDHPFYLSDETMRAYFAKVGFDIVASDASVYQFAYLVRSSKARPYDLSGYATRVATLLRERILTPAPPQADTMLATWKRRLKRWIRGS